MPLPRFQRLAPEKRERILEAAGWEFARSGFEGASLNRILERAEMSKGAAYYYFADKADLFATVLLHAWEHAVDVAPHPEELTCENFWEELGRFYRDFTRATEDHPWMPGVAKAVWELGPRARSAEHLKLIFDDATALVGGVMRRGRELGAVRTDLPEELLMELCLAVDSAVDRWLGAHFEELDAAGRLQLAETVIELTQRLLEPPRGATATDVGPPGRGTPASASSLPRKGAGS